ncbi:hypothetical protein [Neobacillus vireti]|uniref:hypothetical protein n=1 Tax=Neobacillus vireti TaxID=220686 RepID=UPI002FFDFCC6
MTVSGGGAPGIWDFLNTILVTDFALEKYKFEKCFPDAKIEGESCNNTNSPSENKVY